MTMLQHTGAALLLLLAALCGPLTQGIGAEETGVEPAILVGATVSLEGKYKPTSGMITDAYRLWEKQVNARGGLLGRPVRLILYDDHSEPSLVDGLYEKLISEDRVDLVLSPYGTPLTLPASSVSERHRRVMLAAAASGKAIWERGYRHVFGVYALADRYFIGQLDLMARHGLNTVSIIYENSPFNSDVADGASAWAERFGITLAMKSAFTDGALELPGLLEAAARHNAHGLIVSAYPADLYRALRLMQDRQWRPGATGMPIAPTMPDFMDKAGPIGEGVFGPSQWEPDERIPFPGTRQFISDFVAFSGRQPSYHAGSAYAACGILEAVVRQIGAIDHEKIRERVAAMDTVTVIGRFKVDATGKQIGHNPLLVQWQQGRKEIVYPVKMRTAPAIFSTSP